MAKREEQQFGNYQLLKLLSQNDFAEVYLGEHIRLDTKAIIKLLHANVALDEVAVFHHLVHRNIVRVLDFGMEASTGNPYLIMDYSPNGTLRERHPEGTRLPLPTMVAYVRQIAAALQYAHDKGVVHLDVKPENILIGQNDELLLSDFSIARQSPTGSTSYYMAPEQIEGNPGPASDQYALAMMVYEWLYGQPPSRGSDASGQRQHMHGRVPSLSKQFSISPAVERVVLKALARRPKQRFASVGAFAIALERSAVTSGAISRRAVLFGVGGSALASIGIWLLARTLISEKSSHYATSSSAPTPQPEGKLYLTYRGHSNFVWGGVAWSPNGKRIASGSSDQTVQVWDAADGGNVFTYRGHANIVLAVAWSPDGKRIASANGLTVQVWDAADGGNVIIYRGHKNAVLVVAWSPDGKRIASASADGTVQVWDAADGGNAFIYRGHPSYVAGMAWSPDGKRIASGGDDQTVQVWDAADRGNVIVYRGHASYVTGIAWSPDGKRVASGSDDSTVHIWDIANGSAFIYTGHSNFVNTVAWSPDAKRIASGSSDQTVQVWDAANGKNAFIYRGHSNDLLDVAWSPDSKRIASASRDKTVQVWQA
ncbi:MAG TPA: serine/threonine-protein kinase [Ktedonobacteraceae bacterium]|nr:serine/threonine-protein kinase [Ktedonobacteraceae bacterium]